MHFAALVTARDKFILSDNGESYATKSKWEKILVYPVQAMKSLLTCCLFGIFKKTVF